MRARIERWRQRFSPAQASPEAIALSVALGLTLGVFPVYGAPTLLCILAALVARPHGPLLQAINAATGPLQLALWFPLRAVGRWVLPHGNLAWGIVAQPVAGWVLVCVPAGTLVYVATSIALRRSRAQRMAL